MELLLKRIKHTKEETLGKLFIDGKYECWIIEDQPQKVKVMHETRIPAGRYRIKLRTVGRFHEKYSVKFRDMHKGMLHIQNVPGFEFILIHSGNTDRQTSGCLLCNTGFVEKDDRIIGINSVMAYKRLYPKVAKALTSLQEVWIKIEDE